MSSVRSITFGSDYVKQTTGAGILRTDFDRALSALKSQVSANSPSADRARYLGVSEAFLKAYVAASEKLGRGYKAPASTDFAIKNAIRVAKHAVDVNVLDAMKSAIEESLKNV